MSDLVPVKIPPGFFRNGTEYESVGRYYDGNFIRWHNGEIKPIGGWRRVLAGGATLTGRARAALAWRGNTGFRYIVIGTNEKLYIGEGGAYSDVTPVALVTGRADAIEGPGYGAGPYGREKYGKRRTAGTLLLEAATWSFDLWGANLISVLSSDGRIFEWNPSVGGTPAVVVNAPTGTIAVLVTDEGHLMALGPSSLRRKVQWCSQGANTVWAPSATNTAGSRDLKTSSNIMTGRLVGTQPVIWTGLDVHVMDYLGPPLVYGNRRLDGENCGAISGTAPIVVGGTAFWMGYGGFHTYDGVIRDLPCEVHDYVFGDINFVQRSKIFGFATNDFREVGWLYPSANSTENNRRVIYNRDIKKWYFDNLPRTCWLDRGVFTYPIAVDGNGVIWEQEVGLLADGASRNADVFLQSGPAELGSGDRIIYSNLMLPDVTSAALRLTMKMRTAPMGPLTEAGPYTLTPTSEGYVPVRVAGRQAALRYDQIADVDWRIGTQRFKVSAGGRR